VYLATLGDADTVVIKIIVDQDIDPVFVSVCNDLFAKHLNVAATISVDTSRDHCPYDVFVQSYVQGQTAADLVSGLSAESSVALTLVEFIITLQRAAQSVTPPGTGFGLFKKTRPLHATYSSFVRAYIDRYGGRLRATCPDHPVIRDCVHLLTLNIPRVVESVRTYTVTPFDMNLRNVVISAEGRPVLLNVPILAYTDCRLGTGAVAAHLTGTPLDGIYSRRLKCQASALFVDGPVLAFYVAFTLIGVLAFYCASGASGVLNARAWGSESRLLDLLSSSLSALADA
jgi:hypothetical protein